jgi:hypothetical protein
MAYYSTLTRYAARGATAAQLASRNEILLERELCFETDTGRFKVGDGSTPWNDLECAGYGFADLSALADGGVLGYDATSATWTPAAGAEGIRDTVAAFLAAGTHSNVTVAHNDAGNALSLAVAAPYTDEMAQDAVAAMFAAGTHSGITFTYDDANNKISASASGGGGSGAMTYISSATVAGSAATTLTLSGLDMATQQSYYVQFNLKSAAGSNNIGIRINGDSTASNYGRAYVLGGGGSGAFGGNNASNYDLGQLANGEKCTGVGWITTDLDGHVRSHFVVARGGKSNLLVEVVDVVWESAANLTSFGFVASVDSGLAVGSTFKVFKVTS